MGFKPAGDGLALHTDTAAAASSLCLDAQCDQCCLIHQASGEAHLSGSTSTSTHLHPPPSSLEPSSCVHHELLCRGFRARGAALQASVPSLRPFQCPLVRPH